MPPSPSYSRQHLPGPRRRKHHHARKSGLVQHWRLPGSIADGTDIAVKLTAPGFPTPTPTAGHNTVTAVAGTAYAFTADDFGFVDTDTGDTLASVKIVTLPALGTLALDGTDVTLNQVVTKADIDADKLIFTPVAGASGTAYTTFTFKVNDGTVDSASAYTMTIDVTATPVAAICTAPNTSGKREFWTGTTVTVGRTGDDYGYTDSAGGLNNTTFDFIFNATPYTVSAITAGTTGLRLVIDRPLSDGQRANLTLHVCNQAFAFRDASESSPTSSTHAYTWRGALDWSLLAERALRLSAPADRATTGTVSITPSTTPIGVGHVLEADTSTVKDRDGLGAIPWTYQWIRVSYDENGNNPREAAIEGATERTYTTTIEDRLEPVEGSGQYGARARHEVQSQIGGHRRLRRHDDADKRRDDESDAVQAMPEQRHHGQDLRLGKHRRGAIPSGRRNHLRLVQRRARARTPDGGPPDMERPLPHPAVRHPGAHARTPARGQAVAGDEARQSASCAGPRAAEAVHLRCGIRDERGDGEQLPTHLHLGATPASTGRPSTGLAGATCTERSWWRWTSRHGFSPRW